MNWMTDLCPHTHMVKSQCGCAVCKPNPMPRPMPMPSFDLTPKDGRDGRDGRDGADGEDGEKGQSAFECAQAEGFQGTKTEWMASLKGDKGDTGARGPAGPKGDQGDTGPKGDKGAKGDKGDTGPKGDKGATGAAGTNGSDGAAGGDAAADNAGPFSSVTGYSATLLDKDGNPCTFLKAPANAPGDGQIIQYVDGKPTYVAAPTGGTGGGGLTSVATNGTITGDGTPGSPLGVAKPSPATASQIEALGPDTQLWACNPAGTRFTIKLSDLAKVMGQALCAGAPNVTAEASIDPQKYRTMVCGPGGIGTIANSTSNNDGP